MTCLQATIAAGDYLERRLGLRRRLAYLLHIAMCRGCRAYLEQMRLTILGVRSLPRPEGTSPDRDALIERFREEVRRPRE